MTAFPAPRHAGLLDVPIPGATPWRRGKVRDVYELGDRLLVVATDRLSAYDCVLPTPIPDKGAILTALSVHWFRTLEAAVPHHLLSTDRADYPAPFRDRPELDGRSMLCVRAERVDVECVVRGALTGAGFREYRAHGTLNGMPLPPGLGDGAPLDPPLFTPSTKAEEGHDEPIPHGTLPSLVGADVARALEERSIALFVEARTRARAAGLELADTKFEFGFVGGTLTLIDELLSPDSYCLCGLLFQVKENQVERYGATEDQKYDKYHSKILKQEPNRLLHCVTPSSRRASPDPMSTSTSRIRAYTSHHRSAQLGPILRRISPSSSRM